jgi:biopolymer transport protein ExbB
MYPLTALSVFALAGIMERLIFWFAIIKQERKTAEKILVIARQDLKLAAVAAEQSL